MRETVSTDEFRERLADLIKSRKLGHEISTACGWDGFEIMAVFAAALEDANFHRRAAQVEGWYAEDRRYVCEICACPDMLTRAELDARKPCELCRLDGGLSFIPPEQYSE